MKPVQTRHDNDCTAAALAAAFELPIEGIPDFWNTSSQYEKVRRWLAARGFHWYFATCEPKQLRVLREEKREAKSSWPPRGIWFGQVARVEWLRDGDPNHIVVMLDKRCIFNPAGTVREAYEDDVWLLGYYLLVPLDPAVAA